MYIFHTNLVFLSTVRNAGEIMEISTREVHVCFEGVWICIYRCLKRWYMETRVLNIAVSISSLIVILNYFFDRSGQHLAIFCENS